MTPEVLQQLHGETFNAFLSYFVSFFMLGLLAGGVSLAFGENS